MRITDKFVFFFTDKDILSNWYKSKFFYNNDSYRCVEEFMMVRKALLFKDNATAWKILMREGLRPDEKEQAFFKRMGRAVKGFNEDMWLEYRERIVLQGLRLKCEQNQEVKDFVLLMKGKVFAEASPYDKVWGIGLGERHEDAIMTLTRKAFESYWEDYQGCEPCSSWE